MPDVFDQVAPDKQGDVFDQVTSTAPVKGDVFDQVAQAKTASPYSKFQEGLGKYVPESLTGPLSWFQRNINEPLGRMAGKGTELGREAGARPGQALTSMQHPPSREEVSAPLGFQQTEPVNTRSDEELRALAEKEHPVLTGAGEAVGGLVGGTLADPRNWPLMGAGAARPILQRAISGGFALQMGKGAVNAATDLYQNWDKYTPAQRSEKITSGGLTALFAGLAGAHATLGGRTTPVEESKPVAATPPAIAAPSSAVLDSAANSLYGKDYSALTPDQQAQVTKASTPTQGGQPTTTPTAAPTAPQTVTQKTASRATAVVPDLPSPDFPRGITRQEVSARIDDIHNRLADVSPTDIKTPEDIHEILDDMAERVAPLLDPRIEPVIHLAEQQAMADELGLTTHQLLSRESGVALNAEQNIAARDLLAKSQAHVLEMAKRVTQDRSVLASFTDALAKHQLILDQVMGARAEAGRALGSFNIKKEGMPGADIAEAMAKLSSPDAQVAAASLLQKMDPNNPGAINQFLAQIKTASTWDKVHEAWLNGLLSSGAVVKKAVADIVMTTKAPLEKALGADLRGAVQNVRGILHGFSDAIDSFAYTFKNEVSATHPVAGRAAIKGTTGRIVRLPTRTLAAVSDFFGALHRSASIHEQAYRMADSEGLKGQAHTDRVADLIKQPTAEMRTTAQKYALQQTFQSSNRVTSAFSNVRNAVPGGRFVIPIVRTPVNLFAESARNSPLGFLESINDVRKAGGKISPELQHQIGKNVLGTAIFAWAFLKAHAGAITGSGPANNEERVLLQSQGWQPHSYRVGDKFVSYRYNEPLAPAITAAADVAQFMKDNPKADPTTVIGNAISIGVKSASDPLSFMTTLSNFSEALHSHQPLTGASWIRHEAGTLVPGAVSDVAKTMDRTVRNPKTVKEQLESRIPGLSKNVPPMVGRYGEKITEPINQLGGFNPFPVTTAGHNEARYEKFVQARETVNARRAQIQQAKKDLERQRLVGK